ncbi:MAG: M24 family metallopeptidase [Microgenomates group bacterium]
MSLRLKKIINKISHDGAFLISNFYNLLYITGFKGLNPNEREAWGLLTKDEFYFFTDGRYFNKNLFLGIKEAKINLLTGEKNIGYYLKKIVEEKAIKNLLFEADDLKYNEVELFKKKTGINLIPSERLILKEREIKDEEEIEKIRKACEIASESLNWLIKQIKLGKKEKELAFQLEFFIRQRGYEIAFDPIIAFDENSAVVHYNTKENGEKEIKKGSVILVDFGVKFKNYCCDITRMIFYKPKNEVINLYERLKKIQQETINYINKQKNSKNFLLKEVDNFTRQLFNQQFKILKISGYPHSTGHGVGLEIHELPRVSFNSEDILKPGQVFTIEPGIYLNNLWGIRIEDTIFINKNFEAEILTKFPKKAIII